MKKYYILFFITVLFVFGAVAQTPCSQDNPAPVTNIIYTNPERGNPVVAFDLVVEPYTEFSLATVVVKMATANLAALNPTGIVNVYSDAAGLPDTLIGSETITPTVVTEAPISTFAIYTVTFTFTTPIVMNNLVGDTEATYWVGFIMGNVNNGDTGVTGGSMIAGQPYAVINDTSGAWSLGTLDGTYTFEGLCSLSVDEFSLDAISIYPNPTTEKVTIDANPSIQINNIELYDITGKLVLKKENSSSVSLSELHSGIYMMRIKTDNGLVTRKIVKN